MVKRAKWIRAVEKLPKINGIVYREFYLNETR